MIFEFEWISRRKKHVNFKESKKIKWKRNRNRQNEANHLNTVVDSCADTKSRTLVHVHSAFFFYDSLEYRWFYYVARIRFTNNRMVSILMPFHIHTVPTNRKNCPSKNSISNILWFVVYHLNIYFCSTKKFKSKRLSGDILFSRLLWCFRRHFFDHVSKSLEWEWERNSREVEKMHESMRENVKQLKLEKSTLEPVSMD